MGSTKYGNASSGYKPFPFVIDLAPPLIPVLFIDNLPGIMAIDGIPSGRKNESISWKNTKSCMGFTFYSNEDSIGVGIVREGSLVTIARSDLRDFFSISFDDDESESSLVCTIQLDYDKIYVGAIILYNGKITYAGATVSAMGLAIAVQIKINSSLEKEADTDKYNDIFNENGESSQPTDSPNYTDTTVAYETYNGSHGFSFVSSIIGVAEESENVMVKVMDVVQNDLEGLISGFEKKEGIFSIESSVHDQYVYIFMLSKDKIVINTYDGESRTIDEKNLESNACSDNISNVYSGFIFNKPSVKWVDPPVLARIFSPQGVFFRPNTFGAIVLYVPGEDKTVEAYVALPPLLDDGIIDWSTCEKEESLFPIVTNNDVDCDYSQYSLEGFGIIMNPVDSTDILAGWDGTIAYRDYFTEASHGIRSMSAYIPYINKEVT